MEELQTSHKYRVTRIVMDPEQVAMGANPPEPGLFESTVRDETEITRVFQYTGAEAVKMIKHLNTANCSTKSMHKRILEKLSADGKLPGTVVGTPDPAPAAD